MSPRGKRRLAPWLLLSAAFAAAPARAGPGLFAPPPPPPPAASSPAAAPPAAGSAPVRALAEGESYSLEYRPPAGAATSPPGPGGAFAAEASASRPAPVRPALGGGGAFLPPGQAAPEEPWSSGASVSPPVAGPGPSASPGVSEPKEPAAGESSSPATFPALSEADETHGSSAAPAPSAWSPAPQTAPDPDRPRRLPPAGEEGAAAPTSRPPQAKGDGWKPRAAPARPTRTHARIPLSPLPVATEPPLPAPEFVGRGEASHSVLAPPRGAAPYPELNPASAAAPPRGYPRAPAALAPSLPAWDEFPAPPPPPAPPPASGRRRPGPGGSRF